MTEHLPWRSRFKIALIDMLSTLLGRLRGDANWEYIPVWHEDLPVAIVPMHAPEYQALVLLGHSHPEGQEVEWDLEPPYGVDDAQIAAMRQDAIAAMRDVIRRRVAEWESVAK